MPRLMLFDLLAAQGEQPRQMVLPSVLPEREKLVPVSATEVDTADAVLVVTRDTPPDQKSLDRLSAIAANGDAPFGKAVMLAGSPGIGVEAQRRALDAAKAFVFPRLAALIDGPDGGATIGAQDLSEFCAFADSVRHFASGRTSSERQALDAVQDGTPPLWLNHLNLPTTDLARSCRFYIHVLGARYVKHLGADKVVLNLQGFDLFLQQAEAAAVHPDFHFGLRVDRPTLMDLAERLPARGAEIVRGPGPRRGPYTISEGYRTAFYVRDPDGYLIEVYTPEQEMLRGLTA